MYAAAISFESGSRVDWTPVMGAELIADKKPACVSPDSLFGTKNEILRWATHEGKGHVQVLVVLHTIPVKPVRFLMVHGEKVCARVAGPQWVEGFFEGGVEFPSRSRDRGWNLRHRWR